MHVARTARVNFAKSGLRKARFGGGARQVIGVSRVNATKHGYLGVFDGRALPSLAKAGADQSGSPRRRGRPR